MCHQICEEVNFNSETFEISADSKNPQIAHPVHQSQIFQWLNVRTEKYFQYAENSRISSPPSPLISNSIFSNGKIMHQFMLPKIFQLLNVKNMKCTLPSPEIRPIIVGGAPLHVLSAPNKPHQGISSAQYFPHHQSSTYFEPGNED